jgi:hypothetical protein
MPALISGHISGCKIFSKYLLRGRCGRDGRTRAAAPNHL